MIDPLLALVVSVDRRSGNQNESIILLVRRRTVDHRPVLAPALVPGLLTTDPAPTLRNAPGRTGLAALTSLTVIALTGLQCQPLLHRHLFWTR